MMFDTTYRIGEPVVQLMPDEHGDAYEAQVIAPVLAMLPIDAQQAMMVQMGIVRLPMDKQVLSSLIDAAIEARDIMKQRSNIQRATSMSEAEALAEMKRQVDGMRNG